MPLSIHGRHYFKCKDYYKWNQDLKISMCLFIFQRNSHLGEETLLTMPRMASIKLAKAEDGREHDGGKGVRAPYPPAPCCSSYSGFSRYLW